MAIDDESVYNPNPPVVIIDVCHHKGEGSRWRKPKTWSTWNLSFVSDLFRGSLPTGCWSSTISSGAIISAFIPAGIKKLSDRREEVRLPVSALGLFGSRLSVGLDSVGPLAAEGSV